MTQSFSKRFSIVTIVALMGVGMAAKAQEFKGFYSSSDRSAPAARYYRQGNILRGYSNVSARLVQQRDNRGGYYDDRYLSRQNSSDQPYPQMGITVNVFTGDRTQQPTTSNHNYSYYNGSLDYRDNGDHYQYASDNNNDGYNKTPIRKPVKINGKKFYEMNGNYYPADYFNSSSNRNGTQVQNGNNFYTVQRYASQPDNRSTMNLLANPYQSNTSGQYVNNPSYENRSATMDNMSQQQRKTMEANYQMQQQNAAKARDEQNMQQQQMMNQQKQAMDMQQARQDQKAADDKAAAKRQDALINADNSMKAKTDNLPENDALFSDLKVGTTVDQIPKKSKVVTIDGKKTYLAPGNVFYRKENGKYTVVGKE